MILHGFRVYSDVWPCSCVVYIVLMSRASIPAGEWKVPLVSEHLWCILVHLCIRSVLFSHPRRAPWSKPLEHIFQTLLLASAGGSVVWSTSGIMIAMVLTVDPRATAFSSVVCWNGDEFYTSYILITLVKTSVRPGVEICCPGNNSWRIRPRFTKF